MLINILELIAAAVVVELIESAGRTPCKRRYALKSCNDAASGAANFGIAESAAMRTALRIWLEQCAQQEFTVRLVYIDTNRNGIADALSRAEWSKSKREILKSGRDPKKFDIALSWNPGNSACSGRLPVVMCSARPKERRP